MKKYDAIIVGSGPNGFAAAIAMQQQGLSTLVLEGAESIGGGMRSKQLTLAGFTHDVCSAIHPMVLASPFLQTLPLNKHGLRFEYAPYQAAHPLINQPGVHLHQDMDFMADELKEDGAFYKKLLQPIVDKWDTLSGDILGPLHIGRHVLDMLAFGVKALPPASWIASQFSTVRGKALWAGMCAHGMQPLDNWTTSAVGLVLLATAHRFGWAIPVGGSQAIADALLAYYSSIGGEIQTNFWLKDRAELPEHKVLLLDMTPKQILEIKGLDFSEKYAQQLRKFRQGMGVFKMDWALSAQTPFIDSGARQASTVHLGGSFEDIALSELDSSQGKISKKPFVLFSQQSQFDDSRAPGGQHTGWAYCHIPNGSEVDYTHIIEDQIERYAPGFKSTILARHSLGAKEMQAYNPNYVGGDINGGIMDIRQLYTRPTVSLKPYRTSNKSVYICSSSTPPGGGVHGMCGYHAARQALRDHFNILIHLS